MATADEKRKKRQLKADAKKIKADGLAIANRDQIYRERFERAEHLAKVKDYPALQWMLFTEDDFRSVVLGHAWLENALVLLIERHLHNFGPFNVATAGYQQKLKLAQALAELRADEFALMFELGEIRNKFAHRLDAKLVSEDAEKVRKAADKQPIIKLQMDHHINEFLRAPDGDRKIQFNKAQAVIRAAIYLMQLRLSVRLWEPKPVLPVDVKYIRETPPETVDRFQAKRLE